MRSHPLENDDMSSIDAGLQWIETNGRAVDCAELDHVKGADATGLLAALESYANDDGGFGRALEPDVRLGSSSVIVTTIALQLLAECEAPASEPLVSGAMEYLVDTFDGDARAWPAVPPEIDDAPHAPWWSYKPPEDQMINPRAEIVGYMYTWPGFVDVTLRDDLTSDLAALLNEADELEMHEVLVFDRMLRSGLPDDVRSELWAPFRALALKAINTDRSDWESYKLSPLKVVGDPDHPLAGDLADAIEDNLDFLLEQQEDDGSWKPPWSWSGRHPDEWPIAEREIRSRVTTETLSTLIRFGRSG